MGLVGRNNAGYLRVGVNQEYSGEVPQSNRYAIQQRFLLENPSSSSSSSSPFLRARGPVYFLIRAVSRRVCGVPTTHAQPKARGMAHPNKSCVYVFAF